MGHLYADPRRCAGDDDRRWLKSLALAGSLAALSLSVGASSAGAAVTVGQLPAAPPATACASPVDRLQPLVVAGNSYVSPTNGTITSWSTFAGAAAGAQIKLKVFRPVSGLTYQVAAQDVPRPLVPSSFNTFQTTNLPIEKGDLVGLNSFAGVPSCSFVVPGDSYLRFPAAPGTGDLANGGQATFTFSGEVANRRLNIAAVVEPTNTLGFGKPRFNRKKGFALLPVNVPNEGELTFGGKKVKVASGRGATAARTIKQADEITVKVQAKSKKRKKLLRTGKVKVKPKFTFTPTGGTASTQARKLKLRKKR